ncbi:MAG: Ldh family oxidoreductase [Dehalococcoidales bacterium]
MPTATPGRACSYRNPCSGILNQGRVVSRDIEHGQDTGTGYQPVFLQDRDGDTAAGVSGVLAISHYRGFGHRDPTSNLEPNLTGSEPNPLNLQNSFVAAINISLFTKLDTYGKHIDNLIDGLKTLPAAEGFSEIFVPGESEDRTYEERSRNGIALPEGTVHNLRNAAEKFGINLPPGLSG